LVAAPDTIFAQSSGQPPAAIAVIRISGERAHAAAEALSGRLPAVRQATLRKLRGADGSVLDEALLLRFDGPASATGDDLLELHCHGGRAVVAAVLAALGSMDGLRVAEPGEFTRRALQNGRIDLTEAEGLADLLEAETEVQRRLAMGSAEGGTRRLIDGWRQRVIELSARAEAAIDYVGDEDETALDVALFDREIDELLAEWNEWLARPRADMLRRGARVVLAGPPNAGKSSLLNALVGEDKAIVTDIAGTTRDLIEVPLAIDGVPVVLVDTAGLRSAGDEIERIGVARSHDELARADLVLWLGDPDQAPSRPGVVRVHAQSDHRGPAPAGSFAVSARSGEGMVELLAAVRGHVAALHPATDDIALNDRQAGLIREACEAVGTGCEDILIRAEQLRQARAALDRIVGLNGAEETLDALFGRFCLGK
jgi:tRNA modification GTPase